ncbi:MAG: sugar ABC transporter permease [Candidatus Promineifilaceae bacterium]|nr:sugar ABC transporter permease [Candidatus Promineifilaceae bacterium]
MSDTIITQRSESAVESSRPFAGLLTGRRGRQIRESTLAYFFLFPAFLIIFIFGIFPLAFSAYESTLRGLNRIVGRYDGLGNYVNAIGNLAYVLGFWLAIILLFLAVRSVRRGVKTARTQEEQPWLLALPAVVLAGGFMLFLRFFYIFLPLLLGIADQMREAQQAGEGQPGELFRRFLVENFLLPEVQGPFWLAVGVLAVGVTLSYLALRFTPPSRRNGTYFAAFFQGAILFMLTAALSWFTWTEVQAAYAEAIEEGEELAIWSQMVTISVGLVLLILAWVVWDSANNRDSNRSTFLRLGAASMLIVGGWVFIGELPQAAGSGDSDWYLGLLNTVYYSAGSIAVQLPVSLILASFLFQNIHGKSVFRMIYFLPYITPTVGAAAVFRVLFSARVDAPVNSLLTSLGFGSLQWLNEATGVVQLLVGEAVTLPEWAVGPSLALVVIIIFGIWSFIGFNTVIFLAGLGSIPSALYEAASIDGAGRWAQFRNVTLPLLSPTIYFLTLWAVIGTFKAFNHIYVLRTTAALGTVDTASIVIFDAMKRDTRYGYAAALSMLLLLIVMVLTIVNNRIASRRVFYG